MIRYILAYKNENIFKDKRTFKTKSYAEAKLQHYRDWEVMTNTRIGVEVQEIEVETTEEKLLKEIQSLKTMVVEARPVVFSVNKRVDLRPGTYKQLEDWLEKTKDIKVDA